jgi:hypothetical protein
MNQIRDDLFSLSIQGMRKGYHRLRHPKRTHEAPKSEKMIYERLTIFIKCLNSKPAISFDRDSNPKSEKVEKNYSAMVFHGLPN